MKEEHNHHIYVFLPNSVGYHNLLFNVLFNNSLILLKLTVLPENIAQQNAISLCMSRSVLTVLNRHMSATLVLHGNPGKG